MIVRQEAECVTQKRVDVVNVLVLELESLQRPTCLEPEVLLAFPVPESLCRLWKIAVCQHYL